MKKFLAFIVAASLLSNTLFCYVLPGTLTFTCTPQDSGGGYGTWEMIIHWPNGDTSSTGSIPSTTMSNIILNLSSYPTGYIEYGTYTIELKSNIPNPTTSFLSSISVVCTSDTVSADPIVLKNIPLLREGENTQLIYKCVAQ